MKSTFLFFFLSYPPVIVCGCEEFLILIKADILLVLLKEMCSLTVL